MGASRRGFLQWRDRGPSERGFANQSLVLHCNGKSVLSLVCKSTYSGLRFKAIDSLRQRDLARVFNFNLKGYRRSQPGWIADRIIALSLAIEASRIIADAAPCFSGLRRLIHSNEDGHRRTAHLRALKIRDNFRFLDPDRALWAQN